MDRDAFRQGHRLSPRILLDSKMTCFEAVVIILSIGANGESGLFSGCGFHATGNDTSCGAASIQECAKFKIGERLPPDQGQV